MLVIPKILPNYHLSTYGATKNQKIISVFSKEDLIFVRYKITSENVTKTPGFRQKKRNFCFFVLGCCKSIINLLLIMLRSSLNFSQIESKIKKLRFLTVKFWRFWAIFGQFAYIFPIQMTKKLCNQFFFVEIFLNVF